jgi:hypothetical protein
VPRLFRDLWLAAALLCTCGSLAGAQPVKRAPDGPLVTIHAPHALRLELALDEVELDWSRAPDANTQTPGSRVLPAGDARIAETDHARARAVFARAVDRQTLAAKARLLRDANPGAEVHLVVYEPGQPKSPATRKLLTREVGLLLEPDQDVAAVLAGFAASAPRPVPGVPAGYIVEAPDPLAAVDLADALRARPGVKAAYPLLRSLRTKR